MATSKIPVWLDCDPGHDDTFAILLAAYHPRIELLGISTVFGNTAVQKSAINAASILVAINKHEEIPVYVGSEHGIARPPMHHPTDIHGESGIDGTEHLPQPKVAPITAVNAIDAMAKALLAQPAGTAYLVATGPFSNVGLLVQKYPEIVSHIKGLSVMGGVFGGGFTDIPMGKVDDRERIGNYTPWAEFNIIADPEAAAAVFHNKTLAAKTTMAPLDLTHQVIATKEVREMLLYDRDDSSPKTGPGKTILRQMLVDLLLFFAKTYADVYGITAGPPLHDPIAVAAVLQGTPDEIALYDYDPHAEAGTRQKERFSVKVITEGSYEDAVAGKTQTGRTILTKLKPGEEGVIIPRGMDNRKFWDVIEECIERADEVNARAAAASA